MADLWPVIPPCPAQDCHLLVPKKNMHQSLVVVLQQPLLLCCCVHVNVGCSSCILLSQVWCFKQCCLHGESVCSLHNLYLQIFDNPARRPVYLDPN